jgi:hypothetical protein
LDPDVFISVAELEGTAALPEGGFPNPLRRDMSVSRKEGR